MLCLPSPSLQHRYGNSVGTRLTLCVAFALARFRITKASCVVTTDRVSNIRFAVPSALQTGGVNPLRLETRRFYRFLEI